MSSAEGWRRFVRFLFTGGFNAGTCVLFSGLATLILESPMLSFVTGYSLSLILSYFANAIFVFSNRDLSILQFLRFCLSYVPNFMIQLVAVHVLTHLLGVMPILAYAAAVAIAVPLTFFLLSVFTFKRRPATGDVSARRQVGRSD